MLVIIEFIQTDLPEPVAPAIKRWGISSIPDNRIFPSTSLPKVSGISDLIFLNSLESISSLRETASFSLFGTSMPTTVFPGIGASILRSELARAIAILSLNPTILDNFIPGAGFNSYEVITGPRFIATTFASIPKFFIVSSIIFPFSITSFFENRPFTFAKSSNAISG